MTETNDCHTADHGYISDKGGYLARLKRIEGQARGIHRMIDEETYCIDILTQVSALTSALNNVALRLLDVHQQHVVANGTRRCGPEAEGKLTVAAAALAGLLRSYCRPRASVAPYVAGCVGPDLGLAVMSRATRAWIWHWSSICRVVK